MFHGVLTGTFAALLRRFDMAKYDQDAEKALALIDQKADEARQELVSSGSVDAELSAMLGGGLLRETSSFEGDVAEVWGKIALASSDKVQPISSCLNTPFELVDYYCHEVDMRPDDDGEVVRAIRTVLFPKEGPPMACVSDGIARDIWRLRRTFPATRGIPPMPIKIVQVITKPPRRTYKMVPA